MSIFLPNIGSKLVLGVRMIKAFQIHLFLAALISFNSMLIKAEDAPTPKKVETKVNSPKPASTAPVFPKIRDAVDPHFEGPSTARTDQTVILDFPGELGLDPKFDAVPKPETFRVFKDFSGKPAIIVTPGPSLAGKTILVVYADNKGNKTIVATHALSVAPNPAPPVPQPQPNPTPQPNPNPNPNPNPVPQLKYFSDLKAAYLVSPDPVALSTLIDIYKEIGNTTFNKRSDAAQILRNITAKKLTQTQLRSVRDVVHDLLDKDVGTNDTLAFDTVTFKQFWFDVTTALDAIKAGK